MSDQFAITGGRFVVNRLEFKESIDLELSRVTGVSFTKGVAGGDGALVLSTEEREYIVKVPNEDGPDAVAAVHNGQLTRDEPDLLDFIGDE